MPVFDILCLANSNKMRGSCVAGLRLDGGGWIRPVAPGSHGELYPAHYILQDGSCPQIFDRLRISFIAQKAAAHQPENWVIADRPWQLLSRGLSPEAVALLEAHLVHGPALFGDFSHKISIDRLQTEPATSSLCLIRPVNLRWRIEQLPYNAHKVSAQFRLGGTSYQLSVTDPAWLSVFRGLPPGTYPVTACGIPADVHVLFTVSLSDPWEDGYCYKLVAGILPIEADLTAEPREALGMPQAPDPLDTPMDAGEAARIVEALASGTDPYTGEPFPGDSRLSNPETVRALRAAVAALRSGPPGKKPRELPAQAGKAWDTAEEEILVREFEAGDPMSAIARAHGRTPGAIKARLIRLGKIGD